MLTASIRDMRACGSCKRKSASPHESTRRSTLRQFRVLLCCMWHSRAYTFFLCSFSIFSSFRKKAPRQTHSIQRRKQDDPIHSCLSNALKTSITRGNLFNDRLNHKRKTGKHPSSVESAHTDTPRRITPVTLEDSLVSLFDLLSRPGIKS